VYATGILYVDRDRPNFVDLLNLVDEPLSMLPIEQTRPSPEALATIMERLR
jgi:2-oxoglutarate ferredoxin oxidoreductase subunit beta